MGNSPAAESSPILAALHLLLKAHDYAKDTQRDIWDFAVEAQQFERIGLTSTDLRWLTCKGYVMHAREITRYGDEVRTFRPSGGLSFSRRTCFVLTSAGVEYTLRQTKQFAQAESEPSPRATLRAVHGSTNGGAHSMRSEQQILPYWDCDYREIRYNGRLVKEFKLPSPNQEAILTAFAEEGWPPRIDDPLPPHPNCDPKQRLHDTIRSLNRNQKNRLLRFKGDGTGQGVLWEPLTEGSPDELP